MTSRRPSHENVEGNDSRTISRDVTTHKLVSATNWQLIENMRSFELHEMIFLCGVIRYYITYE